MANDGDGVHSSSPAGLPTRGREMPSPGASALLTGEQGGWQKG